MAWIEYQIKLNPFSPFNEIIIAHLSDFGFESFTENEDTVFAYVQKSLENKDEIHSAINSLNCEVSLNTKEIEDQNWNQLWEEQFQPIEVENFCRIRAPFHQKVDGYLDIIIEPKMSFGTGHHSTTYLMLKAIKEFENRIQNSSLLDMGCGTAILAIAAEKIGADKILAIDNDNWAFENSIENVERNNCTKIKVELGDAKTIEKKTFSIILANINRNILCRDMPYYIGSLEENGLIFFSGFFTSDIAQIKENAQNLNLKFIKEFSRDGWACLVFEK